MKTTNNESVNVLTREQVINLYKECGAGNADLLCNLDIVHDRLYNIVSENEGVAEAMDAVSYLLPIAKFVNGIYNAMPIDIDVA